MNSVVSTDSASSSVVVGDENNNNNVNTNVNSSGRMRVVTMSEDAMRQRRSNRNDNNVSMPFVSRHRRTMNHIKTDASEARPYQVPQRQQQQQLENTTSNSGGSSGGDGTPNNTFLNDSTMSHKPTAWHSKAADKLQNHCQNVNREQMLEFCLPCWRWMQAYDYKNTLLQDVVAGLTVGVMVIPQSMSYAKLAGLPVEFGLYSALVPVYAYAVFGSSRQLAVGPVALVSLLLNTGLTQVMAAENLTPEDDGYQARYNTLAIQTSFLVGISYIVMGLLRMGFVTIFLSHAVISGFTTGAAVIIGLSQVKYIVGYDVGSGGKTFHKLIGGLISNADQFNWRTCVMGLTAITCLLGLKHVAKRYPKKMGWARATGPLVVTAVSIGLVVALDLSSHGIPVVGAIPKGLPAVTISEWTPLDGGSNLALVVVSIVIVGFMESIAIGKQLASKHKYEIDASQELIGLGMANFLGGMFQAYPVTGSFSRSAVNNEAGAKSGISGMVTATLVGFVLLLLTVVFEQLPLSILAAIVISGVIGLLDYPEAQYLFRVHKFDFMVWLTACMGTMFLGVEIGLAIAVSVSLLLVVYESAIPPTSVLGRLPGTAHYRNVKQYTEAEVYDGVVVMRIDAPLYFANSQNVRDKIRKYRLKAEKSDDHPVQYLVLEMGPVSHIDTSALHILEDMHVNYQSRGQQLVFCNPSLSVMHRLVNSGLADKIGREWFFPSVHDAVQYCLVTMDEEACSLYNESLQFEHSQHHDDDDDDDEEGAKEKDRV